MIRISNFETVSDVSETINALKLTAATYEKTSRIHLAYMIKAKELEVFLKNSSEEKSTSLQ